MGFELWRFGWALGFMGFRVKPITCAHTNTHRVWGLEFRV